MPNDRRVVVTGLGVVSSIGIGWEEFWKNLIAGKSGISDFISNESDGSLYRAGEIKSFKPQEYLSIKKSISLGRASQFAVIAATLAFKDANLIKRKARLSRIGTFIGTTMGEPQNLETINKQYFINGHSAIKPNLVAHYPAQTISYNVAHELKLSGVNYLIANACSAGNFALGFAFDAIRSGKLNMAVVGGVDSITRLNLTGFGRLLSLAPLKCQPFDKNRKGLLVAEGAGMLFVESLESAIKRKTRIYAEILGYGISCDAHNMTEPTLDGVSKAINGALRNSRICAENVDYISAHGTGTPKNDSNECMAINQIFQNRAVPTSSIKSMLGHTMGAASAIEAISCCLTIKRGVIPPTINYETPDPNCNIDCVPNKARKQKVSIVLNNSFAFGGNNACLVLKKYFK